MNISDLFFTPYREGGRDARGYDCFGLFQELCRRTGQSVPEHPTPGDEQERALAIAKGIQGTWVKLDAPEPGCGVALRIGPWVCHLGMVLDDVETFIHTNEKVGVCIQRLDDPKWSKRIAGFYRHV